MISLVELCGPSRCSGFDSDGTPLASPHPAAWVQVAAVSREQPLALDTIVHTARGDKPLGDVHVGDLVFDERGNLVPVARETEVMEGLECYRLTFDDGTEIVASASHGWTVQRKRPKGDRFEAVTISTAEMAESHLDAMGRNRIRLPLAMRETPDIDLPINPYILGFWLGDGSRRSASFAIRWSERDELASIFAAEMNDDQALRFTHMGNDTGTMSLVNKSRHSKRGKALRTLLREAGLTERKFIPSEYLNAGTEQRRALMQGLIDSDGCVTAQGRVMFTNVNPDLIDGFTALARSLGYKPLTRKHGTSGWIVSFTTPTSDPVARLAHKASRQRVSKFGYRYLRSIERIDSVPVKCIGIDTESHLFQVAGGVITHNTKNTMTMFPVLMSDKFRLEYKIDAGQEIIRANGGRNRLEAVTSNYRSLEGARSTFVLLNEALWIETPIPTPKGFVRMGDLEVGDMIYGKDGVPVPVTHVTEVEEGRACFKVTLPNGEYIVASEGHLWMTKVASSAALPRVRTTLEMVEDGRRFRIPRAGMRHSENTDLPLDPYVLGAWLGDGSTGDANITIGGDDIEAMVAEFARRGVPLHEVGARRGKTGRFSFSHRKGFGSDMGSDTAKALRGLPCYRSKHVPDEYMFAGHEQRLELLRGLMDTDGHVTKGGLCVFVGNAQLSADVVELATSLGFLPSRTFAPDSRSREGGTWRVTFLLEGENPFSLPRKRDRVAVKPRRKWVTIGIEAVPSVPVRCVEVDEENHLFQAGLSFVTHNTQHWVAGNGGIKMYETIDGNAAKGGNRYLAITNAYLPGEDSVAERMRMAYTDILEGRAPDLGSLYDTIEAHPKTGLDPDSLMVAIPLIRGDAVWIDPLDVIASVMKSDIAPARSRRMWLNQIVADKDALITEADWDSMHRPAERIMPGDQVVLGFDGGKTDDATALVAIRVSDGLFQALLIEEKPNDVMQRDKEAPGWEVNREKVDSAVHAAFARYDVVGFYADVALWESYVAQWGEQYGPKLKIKSNEGNGNPVAWDMRGSLRRVTLAHELLLRTILDRKIGHGGVLATELNRALRRHMLNARRRENNHGVGFGKESRDSPLKVDGYAALMLAHTALNDYRQRGKKDRQRTGRGWFI